MRKDLIKIGVGLLSAGFIWIILLSVAAIGGKISDWLIFPLAGIGSILILVGLPVTVYGIIAAPLPIKKTPKTKRKIKPKPEKIEEANPLSILMTDLKFGVFFIVAGFLIRLLLVNVIAEEYTDVEKIISVGDWLLILFVVIGVLIIGFGIVEYTIGRKKRK